MLIAWSIYSGRQLIISLVPYGIAIAIFAFLTRAVDKRPALILAIEYGLILVFYIFWRMINLAKRKMV